MTPQTPHPSACPEPSRRLTALVSHFDAVQPRLLSLDVFDTLLYRPFERPVDVFVEVHRAITQSGTAALTESAEEFSSLRVQAEQQARNRHPSGEITVHEIAAELSRLLPTRPAIDALVEAEVTTEGRFIQLDRDIAALIQHAAERGVPYVLVSDMYLCADHLRELLRKASQGAGLIIPDPKQVFVSGEHRTNKGGQLFSRVLGELGLDSTSILHVGDHPLSDVESPRRQGIHVIHYHREGDYMTEVFARERRYLAGCTTSRTTGAHNDLGLRTLRSKALLSSSPDAPLDAHGYGAYVVGPVLTLFAEWVADDCVQRGQSVVYCLMREGKFLSSLINQVAQSRGLNLHARPLWASRYALRAASYRHANEQELRSWFAKRKRLPLAAFARDLGLDPAELRPLTGITHDEPLGKGEQEKIIASMIADRDIRQKIMAASAKRRQRLLEYYQREGVFDRPELTVVDLGWGGSIQKNLARLFQDRERPEHVRGLYFATNDGILDLPLVSCSAASFLFALGQPQAPFDIIRRTPEIIEQVCMPEEGSFAGVSESGEIENFPQLIPQRQIEQVLAIQDGVRHFATLWLPRASERRGRISHADWELVLARLRATLIRSIDEPTLDEVRIFEDWVHDDNDGSDCSDALLGDSNLRNRARGMSYRQIQSLSWLKCFWPQGLACIAGIDRPRREKKVGLAGLVRRLFRPRRP
jgi:FMN phosphatase YigB (HAD superfamily)